jgi:hypothetical protein
MAMSSLLGVGLPEGWLWATTAAAEFDRIAGLKTSRDARSTG